MREPEYIHLPRPAGPFAARGEWVMIAPNRPHRAGLVLLPIVVLAAACAGPTVEDVPSATATVAVPTATAAPPTAAVGQTVGSACESGKLRFSDLTAMEDQWRDGLAVARGRALGWQPDAVLVELQVACQLFEPGFRWQATYFSRVAQAYFSTDTAEIVPVEIDPSAVRALPEEEIRFAALRDVLASNGYDDTDPAIRLESLRLLMSTEENRVGPDDLPANHVVANVRVVSRGEAVDLYVDLTAGGIYRYGGE